MTVLARWAHPPPSEARGPEAQAGSSIVRLRLSAARLARRDRSRDGLETVRRAQAARPPALRAARPLWLDQHAQQAGRARPDQARRAFRAAYDRGRPGQDPVRLPRIRHARHWPHEPCEAGLAP